MYKKIFPAFLKMNVISPLIRPVSSGKFLFNPSTYVLSDKLQKTKALIFIDEFDEYLKIISGKCMDVGCGPGDITKNILLPALDPNAVITGTDISESMIEYAKKTCGANERLKFEVLDIQTKKLPKEFISEFDHVFSLHSLHWCYDIRQAFENIYRMLRPNGTMLVLFVASHDIFKVLEHMAQDIRFASYMPDINKYIWPYQNSINSRKELKELLRELGFTVIHCSFRETYFSDTNSNHFSSAIMSFLKFIDEMPYDRKEEFKKEFTRKFAETVISYKRADETISLDLYNVLIAFAQKRIP